MAKPQLFTIIALCVYAGEMAVSLVVAPVVSVITKKKDTKRVEEIFECYKEA